MERTKAHLLGDILTIGLCAVLCGADGWTDMATFGPAKEAGLRTFLALPNGIPRHDPFCHCFTAWVQAGAPETRGPVRAVDGKTLRGVPAQDAGQAALHLVCAWEDQRGGPWAGRGGRQGE